MNKITPKPLSETLPYAIARNTKAKYVAASVDPQLKVVYDNLDSILILPNLDRLPENILDSLAWQYHVDFYSQRLDLEKKRALLRSAIGNHRIKGTPAAVEAIVKAVFKSGRVFENWEYGGAPYHFQVKLIEEACQDEIVVMELLQAIDATKNVRSWCDGLYFYRESKADFKFAFIQGTYRKLSLYPAKLNIPPTQKNIDVGIRLAQYRKAILHNKPITLIDSFIDASMQIKQNIFKKMEVK